MPSAMENAMKQLSYETLKETGYSGYLLPDAPERVLQFGEGNFMRAFVEHFVDVMNEKAGFASKVVLVQPRAPHGASARTKQALNGQNGLYTLYLRGSKNGSPVNHRRVISCVSRCLNAAEDFEELLSCAENPELRFLACNTTEAGIVYDPACLFTDAPAASFPGKLTQFLYRRYEALQQGRIRDTAPDSTERSLLPRTGFLILACELIDDNGKALRDCVLRYARQWELGADFSRWIQEDNLFCSTLVDRIVTGYPKEADALNQENGWIDACMDAGELFASWVIEGPQDLKSLLPFEKAGLPVLITDDHKPYKQRKVRILNGAHTSMVLGAYLAGKDIVRDCMTDAVIRGFMERTVHEEIIPTLALPVEELEDFAAAVTERFANPYIDHSLLAISLNSTSKWKARVLPSLLEYTRQKGALPPCLTASLAFYLAFYLGSRPSEVRLTDAGLTALRPDGTAYCVSDDRQVLAFFYDHRQDSPQAYVRAVCSRTDFWGQDLTALPGLEAAVCEDLEYITRNGAYAMMEKLVE